MQGCVTVDYAYVRVSEMMIGKVKFPDVEAVSLQTNPGQVSKTLASRKLVVGTTKNGVIHVQCFVYHSGSVEFENVGESKQVRLKIDGTQVDWDVRNDGTVSPYYAASASASAVVTLDNAHTIEVENDVGTAYVSVVFTPWILPSSLFEPLTLDFPQGSTIYVVEEPLFENPAKTVKIGKKRAVSFGDSADYYYTASGADILSASYTFETVKVDECTLLVNGYGGCISIIAVDVR